MEFMSLKEYLNAAGKADPSLLEKRVFGIPQVLKGNWMKQYGMLLISVEDAEYIVLGDTECADYLKSNSLIKNKTNKSNKPDPRRRKHKSDDEFYKSKAWRELRYKILKKFGARCQCCGVTSIQGKSIHVDHIKPRSRYPKLQLVESNLQVLCEDCNLGKGYKDQTDWRPKK